MKTEHVARGLRRVSSTTAEKKSKNPLSGVVCPLTTGDLIRVRCRSAVTSIGCGGDVPLPRFTKSSSARIISLMVDKQAEFLSQQSQVIFRFVCALILRHQYEFGCLASTRPKRVFEKLTNRL